MKRRLPSDAFDYYLSLGVGRSYVAVAQHFRVSKATVTRRATKELWQLRTADIEAKARAASDDKAADTLEAMNSRHLKAARLIQAKALEALRSSTLESAMEAVKALDLGTRQERLILGEPTERTALDVAEIVKRESARWLVPAGDGKAKGRGDQSS